MFTQIETKHQHRYLFYLFIISFSFYILFIFRTSFRIDGNLYFTLIDDAMISMRYARNLSAGSGLVWNVGEAPIQGITNLGWTLFMGLVHLFPFKERIISLPIMITSAVILVLISYTCFSITRKIAPGFRFSPLISATIISFYYPLVFWSLRGMEVGVCTLFIFLMVLFVINKKIFSLFDTVFLSVMMFIAILIRFDLIVPSTIILGYVSYNLVKNKQNWKQLVLLILFYLLGIITLCVFQKLYFGSFLPNTYYLKVTGVSIIERITLGIRTFIEYSTRDFIAIFIFVLMVNLIATKKFGINKLLLFTLFVMQCAYSVYVGGDYAEPLNFPQVDAANRFIAQGMPAIIILFSITIDDLLQKKVNISILDIRLSIVFMVGICFGSLLIISGEPWADWVFDNAPMLDSDIWRTERAIHIKKYSADDATIATHVAGQIPYYTNRRTIDLLGKNDAVIAMGDPAVSFRPGHNKWNYEYSIMGFLPDIIADEWGEIANYLSENPLYVRLDNGIWVNVKSQLIDIEGLSSDHSRQ